MKARRKISKIEETGKVGKREKIRRGREREHTPSGFKNTLETHSWLDRAGDFLDSYSSSRKGLWSKRIQGNFCDSDLCTRTESQ